MRHFFLILWGLSYFLVQPDAPSSPCTFPAPALDSNISSRISAFFSWRMVSENHDLSCRFAHFSCCVIAYSSSQQTDIHTNVYIYLYTSLKVQFIQIPSTAVYYYFLVFSFFIFVTPSERSLASVLLSVSCSSRLEYMKGSFEIANSYYCEKEKKKESKLTRFLDNLSVFNQPFSLAIGKTIF